MGLGWAWAGFELDLNEDGLEENWAPSGWLKGLRMGGFGWRIGLRKSTFRYPLSELKDAISWFKGLRFFLIVCLKGWELKSRKECLESFDLGFGPRFHFSYLSIPSISELV